MTRSKPPTESSLPGAAPRGLAPNFITEIIERDLASGKVTQVVTRFPPEPNGYVHLGHTFASFLDFQTAVQYGGRYHLRLDDTNPRGERAEFAEAIQDDLAWLGWQWGDQNLYYASDNFEAYYAYAVRLVELGKAYIDSVSGDEMRRLRGSASEVGTPSPYRGRSVTENLDLLSRMRAGEFPDGAHVLRAKIDLSSPNMKLRDPVLYRILRAHHYRQGDEWCIYPMYDFQHPLQDALEGVTHSMCSLEFVDNRAIYDWLMETLAFSPRPYQYEFGRRSLEYTVVSKRKLRRLVDEGHVSGWDDPRMPTLRAVRRLGVTPEAVLNFSASIGVSRTNRTVDLAVYENAVRDDLNPRAPRVMAVTDPVEVLLRHEDGSALGRQTLSLPYWPHDVVQASPDGLVALPGGARVAPEQAARPVTLSGRLYIEREDVALNPPKGFKRLTLGGAVRLRGAGVIRADHIDVGDDGQITRVQATLLGDDARAAGVIHWVDAETAVKAEFRLYDRLFSVPNPDGANPDEALPEADEADDSGALTTDFLRFLNPHSLRITHGYVERSVAQHPADTRYQFERQGYFWADPVDSRPDALVFNRIITLRDAWGKAPPRAETTRPKSKEQGEARKPEAPSLSPEQTAEVARLRAQGVGGADTTVLARDPLLLRFFADAGATTQAAQVAAWIVNDLAPALREGGARVRAAELGALAELLTSGRLSSRMAKEVLAEALSSGEAPAAIVERRGLQVVSDTGALDTLIAEVIAANPDKLAAYRAGKLGLMGFFTGQVMQRSQGQADPQAVATLLRARLDAQE
jgi:glutaminyl-tRNA synthetase